MKIAELRPGDALLDVRYGGTFILIENSRTNLTWLLTNVRQNLNKSSLVKTSPVKYSETTNHIDQETWIILQLK